MKTTSNWIFCQSCGARNADDRELCVGCQQKLMVISGGSAGEEVGGLAEVDEDESFSFDEHLLERISVLEEAAKRTAETVDRLVEAIDKQERSILVNHTAFSTLRDLLEGKGVVGGEEWRDQWSANVDRQLAVLERRERFLELRDRATALYRGDRAELFLERMDEAEVALYSFDVERAQEALEAALDLDEGNVPLACFLGEMRFAEGDGTGALEAFGRVLEAEPGHFEALVYSGVIRHEEGDDEGAVERLERAVELHPDAFLARFSLGVVRAERGERAAAVEHLERAVAIDPVPQALYFLGKCRYEGDELGAAIRHLEEAVRHDPEFDEAHLLLGLAYLDRRWTAKALEAFRRAQRLRPKRMRYHDMVRFLSGQASAPLPDVTGEAGELVVRAEEALAEGSPERALTCLRRALALEPGHPTLLVSVAVTALGVGRLGETETVARQLIAGESDELVRATAYATLMEALRSDGRLEEGNRVGRRLLAEATSGFARTVAYYELACNLAEMDEDLDLALEYARRCLEAAPEELRAFPLAALGRVHSSRGEYDEAVGYLARSSETAPSPDVLTHLGMALLAAGHEEEARRVLAEARDGNGRGVSLEQRMMEFMKDSRRLLERVQERQRKRG